MKELYEGFRDLQKNGGTTEQKKQVILELIMNLEMDLR